MVIGTASLVEISDHMSLMKLNTTFTFTLDSMDFCFLKLSKADDYLFCHWFFYSYDSKGFNWTYKYKEKLNTKITQLS